MYSFKVAKTQMLALKSKAVKAFYFWHFNIDKQIMDIMDFYLQVIFLHGLGDTGYVKASVTFRVCK